MSEHTKEPWEVWTSNSHIRISADGKDGSVVSAMRAADGMPVLAIKETDARRIVACVNACAGFYTETLELSASGDAPSLREIFIEHGELRKQCYELLELAKLARKELAAFADELRVSSTIGGEWDGTEHEAKEEYDRLISLATKLAEKVEAAQ